MTAAILFITVGAMMVLSALKGVSITDVLKGVTGDPLDPKGGNRMVSANTQAYADEPTTNSPTTGTGKYPFQGPNAALLATLAAAAETQFDLTVTSVCRGKCSPNCGSYHEKCRAFDSDGSPADRAAYARWAWDNYGDSLAELFYAPAGITVKNGHNMFPAIFDTPDHVHTAA